MVNKISAHIKNLSSDDFQTRNKSINFLINHDNEANHKNILGLLKSEDAIERNSSMEILVGLGETVLDHIIKITKSSDINQRIYSANILGEIKSEKSIDSLLILLEDEESNVRFAAAEAIGKIGSKEATMPLLHYLYSRKDDPWEQFPLILTLGEIKDERSVIPLLQLIENDMLKQPILQAISTIADENALPYIIDLIKSSDDETLEMMSILAIKHINDKVNKYSSGKESLEIVMKKVFENIDNSQINKIIQIMDRMIINEDFSVKIGSILMLGFISQVDSLAILLNNYSDDLSNEIEEAISNIAKNNYKIILDYLSNENIDHQDILIRVLGKLGITEIKNIFISKLDYDKPDVKIQSIKAITKIADENDLPYIFKMVKDENEDVKNTAIESLGKFDENKILTLLNDFDIDELSKIKIISKLDLDIKEVLAFYQSEELQVRKTVAEILKKYPKNVAQKELIELLNDESVLVRESAIRTIEYRKEDIKNLYDLLIDNQSDWIRYYFAKSLAYQNIDADSVNYLKSLLNDQVPFVRISAIETLGKIEQNLLSLENYEIINQDFLNKLIELSDNADPDISKSAIIALSNFNYDPDKFYNILKSKFNNKDWIIRKSVAYVLKLIDDSQIAYKIMLEMIDKENENLVLKEIICSLAAIYQNISDNDQILFTLLNYTLNDDLREFTINVISAMDKSIIHKLQNYFDISGNDLKMNIISIIANIDDEKSLQFLIKLSSYDSSPKIRKHTILSLNNFKNQQRALWAIMWAANHDTDLYVNQTAKSLLVS